MNYTEAYPYSSKLRQAIDQRLTAVTYTETEVLNSLMELAVQRESENIFNEVVTKDVYFSILYDIITNILFKKNIT